MKKMICLAVCIWNLWRAIGSVAKCVSLIATAGVWPWLAYLLLFCAFAALVKATFEMIRLIIE
jgi:hypothetical protein